MIKMRTMKNHDDWLKNRQKRIGGSEAAAVIGLNPYMSNVELWELKTGRRKPVDISDKPYVKYGTEAEAHLRELFRLDFPQYILEYVSNNMWLNDRYPFAHASLDGWLRDQDGRLGIWECKTTEILHSMQKEKWKNKIPDNYYVQILHYMAVMGAQFAILKAQLKYDFDGDVKLITRHYKIERADVEEDISYLMKQEELFWQSVINDERPALILPEI